MAFKSFPSLKRKSTQKWENYQYMLFLNRLIIFWGNIKFIQKNFYYKDQKIYLDISYT